MAKLFAAFSLLVVVTPAAIGAPIQASRADAGLQRQSRYWLSRDMQRLVFWQAPAPGAARR